MGSKRSPQRIRFDTDLERGYCESDGAVGDLLSGRSRWDQWSAEAVVGDPEGIENLVERKEEKTSKQEARKQESRGFSMYTFVQMCLNVEQKKLIGKISVGRMRWTGKKRGGRLSRLEKKRDGQMTWRERRGL